MPVCTRSRVRPRDLIRSPSLMLVVLAASAGFGSTVRAQDFSGCGVLVQGVECVLFSPYAGGLYVLDALGPFGPGDEVWVTGKIDPGCFTFCLQGDGCIHNTSIGKCLDGCGVIVQGVECNLFAAYGCAGTYVLFEFGGFTVGDTVRVTGCLNPACISFCQQGDGCIEDNTITKACPADLDCDGDTDQSDLGILLATYGVNGNGDLDGDCDTDQFDLGILLSNFGCKL
jgi:hypothetical protein